MDSRYDNQRSEPGTGALVTAAARCAECGGEFSQEEMVNFGQTWVCAGCKAQYVQKLREGVTVGGGAQLWRSGKQLVMKIDAALPHRCVKCNEPTEEAQIKRKLYWHHPAVYLALLLNVLIYCIVAICCRKRATASVSICAKHRAARRKTILASWLLVLGGIAAIVAAIVQESGWMAVAGAVMLLGGIIYGVARGRLVYATKIDKEHVWLGGCKPEYLASLPEWTGAK